MSNSIEIVIVLYQCSLEESVTFQSLSEHLKNTATDCELIIYNNDVSQKIEHSEHIVVNSEENRKLEGAYNFALKRAAESGRNWILLLDQDTKIPDNYFSEVERLFSGEVLDDLVAVVPKLVSNGKVISPVFVSSLMRFEKELETDGYTYERINALNSLSLFNVQFIQSIGGFSKDFPFDFHDHWCYNQVYNHQKSVYVLDVTSEHESSFVEFEKNVSPDRYRLFLNTESRFIRNETGLKVFIFYKMKLIMRSLKQLIQYRNKKFAAITFWAALNCINNKE